MAETNAGGGVWRVKWHPSPDQAGVLLCAAMHNGFTVLKYDHGSATFDSDAALHYTGGHTSLGYGADWQAPNAATGAEGGDNWLIGSASFYDHRLEVWSVVPTGDRRSVDPATKAAAIPAAEAPHCCADPRVQFDMGRNAVREIPHRSEVAAADFLPGGWSFTAH